MCSAAPNQLHKPHLNLCNTNRTSTMPTTMPTTSEAATTGPPLPPTAYVKPGGREGVLLCMNVTEYKCDDTLSEHCGKNMMRVACTNCISKGKEPKTWDSPVARGYTNQWTHFTNCVGKPERVKEIVIQRRLEENARKRAAAENGNSIAATAALRNTQLTLPFVADDSVTSIHQWLQLIVLKNMPISDVECKIMQKLVKNSKVKSSKTVMDTAHCLVRNLEDKIATMMQLSDLGQLIHDGYSVGGQHFVAVYASFMVPYDGMVNGVKTVLYRHELRLLAVAPLPPLEDEDGLGEVEEEEEEEAEEFNAAIHINFFEKTLQFYGMDHDEWVVCQCADSASVNRKIAKDSHGNHISCNNHNLALAGKGMLEDDADLRDVMEQVSLCNAHVRGSNKVSTSLRNRVAAADPRRANIRPKSESATRQWMGSYVLLKRHHLIKSYLSTLVDDNVARMREFEGVVTAGFMDRVVKHLRYQKPLRQCNDMLQKHKLPLIKTQGYLDHLIDLITTQQGEHGQLYEHCRLQLKKIRPDNGLTTTPDFVTGVMKIQGGIATEKTMTRREKDACNRLLKPDSDDSSDEEEDGSNFARSFAAGEKRKSVELTGKSKYINCDFIVGSAAIVESLWSEQDALLTKRRRGMSPITNECILFLKKNKDLWSISDVNEANNKRLSNNKDARLAARLEAEAADNAMENALE